MVVDTGDPHGDESSGTRPQPGQQQACTRRRRSRRPPAAGCDPVGTGLGLGCALPCDAFRLVRRATGKLGFALADLAALPRAALVVEDRYSQIFTLDRVRPAVVLDGLAERRCAGRMCPSCSARPGRWPKSAARHRVHRQLRQLPRPRRAGPAGMTTGVPALAAALRAALAPGCEEVVGAKKALLEILADGARHGIRALPAGRRWDPG